MPVCQFQHFPDLHPDYTVSSLHRQQDVRYNPLAQPAGMLCVPGKQGVAHVWGQPLQLTTTAREDLLSRVYNPESAGKDRSRLTRAVVISLRELMRQPEPNPTTRDLAAFIALALNSIAETIDPSVAAWEKRGYWVKADRFRLDWAWTARLSDTLGKAVLAENWGEVAQAAVQIATKLQDVKVPVNHRMGTPWTGAWVKLRDSQIK
ncbi:MAG TPA: hypothetical protein VN363_10175 [Anaerolineales bacterium]|nr:hypothetical protein [Anaerolineales bacterium]